MEFCQIQLNYVDYEFQNAKGTKAGFRFKPFFIFDSKNYSLIR